MPTNDQKITELPVKTSSGITASDYLLGIDSSEGYQMLIQDLGDYIIQHATSSLAGTNQTLSSVVNYLNNNDKAIVLPIQSVADLDTLLDGYDSSMAAGTSYRGRVSSTASHTLFGQTAYILEGYKNSVNYAWQKMTSYGSNNGYFRVKDNGTWGNWQLLPTRAEVDALNTNDILPGGRTVIPDSADMDDYKTPGVYAIASDASAATLSNLPLSVAGKVIVWLRGNDSSYVQQKFIPLSGEVREYARNYNNGTWTAWNLLPYRAEVSTLNRKFISATSVDTLSTGILNMASSAVGTVYMSETLVNTITGETATGKGYAAKISNTTSDLTFTIGASGTMYTTRFNPTAKTFSNTVKLPTRAEVDTLNSKFIYATSVDDLSTKIKNMTANTVGTVYMVSAVTTAITGISSAPIGKGYTSKVNDTIADIVFAIGVDGEQYSTRFNPTAKTFSNTVKLPTRAEIDALNGNIEKRAMGSQAISIPENADLNNYLTYGLYCSGTASISVTLSNTPITTAGFLLEVKRTSSSDTILKQEITVNTSLDVKFSRCHNNAGWSDWITAPKRSEITDLYSNTYNLKTGTQIPSGADFDTYDTPGTFFVLTNAIAAACSHCPSVRAGKLIVEYTVSTSTILRQTYIEYTEAADVPTANVFVRVTNNGTSAWRAWQKLPTRAEVDALASKFAQQIPNNTDLNSLTTEGLYYNVQGTYTFSNSPYSGTFTLQVYGKSTFANQLMICNDSTMFFRVQYSTGWQTWKKITTTAVS